MKAFFKIAEILLSISILQRKAFLTQELSLCVIVYKRKKVRLEESLHSNALSAEKHKKVGKFKM